MSEPTLTDFLLARIAEDEAEATEAAGDQAHQDWALNRAGDLNEGYMVWHALKRLKECEAKRRIVERWIARARRTDDRGRPAHEFDAVLSMLLKSHEADLRDLALPYADHPDYREEWRP